MSNQSVGRILILIFMLIVDKKDEITIGLTIYLYNKLFYSDLQLHSFNENDID